MKKQKLKVKTIRVACFLLSVLSIISVSLLQAQDKPAHDMAITPEQRIERMIDRLDLSVEQAEAVRWQMTLSQTLAQEILDRYGLTREDAHAMREELRATRADFKETMESMLNEEQMKELQGLQKERLQTQDKPAHDMAITPEQRIERLIDRLGLSVEQAEAVRWQMTLSQTLAQEIMDRYGLTREDAHTLREELRATRADSMDSMEVILDEEQMEVLQGLQKEYLKSRH